MTGSAMKGILPLALAAVFVAGCAHVNVERSLAVRIDELIAPLVDAHEFSGAVVMARRGKIVYQRGFGMANHAGGLPFTPDTPTDGASLAKTFTAAGIWWLADEGKVDLDAPVTRYVGEFPHARTTVRQLLSHSSGLPADYAYFDQHFKAGEVRTTQAMLELIARNSPSPQFPPGTRFEYSSLGFDVAALVIERVTGQRYEDFLEQRFFSRLEMRASFVRPARLADWKGVRTLGYRWRADAWAPHEVFDMEAFRGGSNIYFSAGDLSRWASANGAGAAVPAAVSASGRRRGEVAGQRSGLTGLSWYCDGTSTRCYYTGDLNAFYAFVYWDRDRDESVVYVSNSTLPPWRRAGLARDLVEVLRGNAADVSGPEVPMGNAANASGPAVFAHFNGDTRSAVSGAYVASGVGRVTLTSDAARALQMRMADGLEYQVFQVSREVFYAPGLDLWLAFSGQSPPTRMHLRSVFVDTILHRVPG